MQRFERRPECATTLCAFQIHIRAEHPDLGLRELKTLRKRLPATRTEQHAGERIASHPNERIGLYIAMKRLLRGLGIGLWQARKWPVKSAFAHLHACIKSMRCPQDIEPECPLLVNRVIDQGMVTATPQAEQLEFDRG